MLYASRTDAIEREIIAAIEASDVTNASAYNIDVIADQVLTTLTNGSSYYYTLDDEVEFWQIVAANELI